MNAVNSDDDMNLSTLGHIIQKEQTRLEEDKLKLQGKFEAIKERQSDGNHNKSFHELTLPKDKYDLLPNNVDDIHQTKEKCSMKDKPTIFFIKNPREEEINKLIDKISKPKEQLSFSNGKRGLRKSYPQYGSDYSQYLSLVNIREREKDQLSEKFASSESPLTKPSCRQIAKNLYSSITFNDFKLNNLEKASDRGEDIQNVNKEYFANSKKSTNLEDREEYLRAKYKHPKIVISHYQESDEKEDIGDCKNNKMVRIGEFSPLNPNVPGGATVLGLGEWEERRQLLLENYRQVSRSPSPSSSENYHGHNQRSIAIQTDLSDNWSTSIPVDKSPQRPSHVEEKSPQTMHIHDNKDDNKRCTPPDLRLSSIPKCFEYMTEKEIKEFIYRQDLEKQIEEKNRLKEEMRKKEAEEEAKIEAKIERDLEKMRRQYEEERLQRLELAIRRKEQEDLFRQRLAVEQQKAIQESKVTKKRPVKNSALPNYTHKQHEKSTQSEFNRSVNTNGVSVHYSHSLPERSAASALACVHEELRQPLLQPSSSLFGAEGRESFSPEDAPASHTRPSLQRTKKTTSKTSPSLSEHKSKEVDILAQKAVFDTNLKTSPRMNYVTFSSDTVRDRLREVDNILKQPLLPESRVLPPVSQPLLHATIPPLSTSLQTPRDPSLPAGSTNRTYTDILEDKWKVPYVEKESEPTNTKHNTRILTQLGTFRRQLQEESLRMRQRVREDSP